MEAFYRTHAYLIEHTNPAVRRALMDEVNWNDRMIGIKGSRGIGKTTFLLQYAKEYYGKSRSCLYINMNNFYFCGHSLYDFAVDFISHGGKVLLIDQVFKYPEWSAELRKCYDECPTLKIVFTFSSVTSVKDECPEIADVVKVYDLHGFSFREFLNLSTAQKFKSFSLEEILEHHDEIISGIVHYISPLDFFQNYLHHGYYPFFMENRNFSENLLKTMNMMIEVDILLIKQIELKYLSRIKKLLYKLAIDNSSSPNISQLAEDIQTSRATVMNYIKYLMDANLINMIYPESEEFPKKPSHIMLYNTNLAYAIFPHKQLGDLVQEIFFTNALCLHHTVNKSKRSQNYIVDGKYEFRLNNKGGKGNSNDMFISVTDIQTKENRQIPLWLLGFLY